MIPRKRYKVLVSPTGVIAYGSRGMWARLEGEELKSLGKPFWAVFLSIAINGTVTWLAIFEYNYGPRIYRYNAEVTILQIGDSELDFNHPPGAFSIWWQSGRRNVRVWLRSPQTVLWARAHG